jgi:hypothetical protein
MTLCYDTGVTIFTLVLGARNIFQGIGTRNNQESESVTGKEKRDRVLERLYFAVDDQLFYKSQILFQNHGPQTYLN